MPCNKYVSICTIPVSPILFLSSESFVISKEPLIMVSLYILPPLTLSLPIRMPTGQDVQILAGLRRATVCSWATIWCLRRLAASLRFLGWVQRLNIVLLRPPLRKHAGFAVFFRSFGALLTAPLLSTVTTSVQCIYLLTNHVQHRRMKHIELDIHFVREKVALGALRVLHVPSSSQFADIFTKGLSSVLFTEFRASLHVREPPSSDCGGVLWRYPPPCKTKIS
jgi:hypothetical protein